MITSNITHLSEADINVLASLRALRPVRHLSFEEELRVAELQANRLLALHGVARPAVPVEIVSELPRITVRQDLDLPSSGLTYWDGEEWVVTIRAVEPPGRKRFSVMHEFKHVLDHPTRHKIEPGSRSEQVADYFAGCVLMPKRWLAAAWCSGHQSFRELASMFEVTPRAVSFRLNQLGYRPSVPRCNPTARRGADDLVTALAPDHPHGVLSTGVSP